MPLNNLFFLASSAFSSSTERIISKADHCRAVFTDNDVLNVKSAEAR